MQKFLQLKGAYMHVNQKISIDVQRLYGYSKRLEDPSLLVYRSVRLIPVPLARVWILGGVWFVVWSRTGCVAV